MEITSRIFLGNIQHAKNRDVLEENDIKHVFNICASKRTFKHRKINYFNQYNVFDEESQNMNRTWRRVIPKMKNCLKDPGSNVMVHCFAGRSRSPSVVIAYLVKEGMNLRDAYELVKNQYAEYRICLNINDGFKRQLMDYEKCLKGDTSLDFFPPVRQNRYKGNYKNS